MLKMFVPKAVFKNLPKNEIKRLIEGVLFSALPVTKRTKGIIFDLFVSNPSISDKVPFDNIRSPTLILNAIDDSATLFEGARNLAGKIHGAKLVTYKSGGHLILGQEEEIKNQIRKFIEHNL